MVHQCGKGHGEGGLVTAADCKTCSDYVPQLDLKSYFERVVVINLKRRDDRLLSFRKELADKGWPFKEPGVFEAIEGDKVGVPDGYQSGGGAWGCLRSHISILERAMMDGVKSLLVLEDDACFRSSFTTDVTKFLERVPDNWDQLMLGGQHMHGTAKQIKEGVVKCYNCQRTHAYAIRPAMMRELYRMWCKCEHHCDWAMGPFQKDWNVYAPEPFVVGQARSRSDISGAVNPTKFWMPAKGDEKVLVLKCDKYRVAELRDSGIHTGYQRNPVSDIDVGLIKVFAHKSERRRLTLLRNWLDDLMGEVVSAEGLTLGVWHPEATVEMVKAVWPGGEVMEIS